MAASCSQHFGERSGPIAARVPGARTAPDVSAGRGGGGYAQAHRHV